MAVYFTLLKPGDTVLAPNLAHGGHLTAGSPMNFSGKLYAIVPYGVRKDTERIDLDQVRDLARQHRPKLIIAGGSAFPRAIDFEPFREIADEVGAALMADIAHPAGLVAAGLHPSPVPLRRLRHHDHAQDAARPARRHGDVPDGVRQGARPDGPARHPGRPADARDRRQGRGVPRGPDPGVARLPAADRRQRARARGGAHGPRATASSRAAPTPT